MAGPKESGSAADMPAPSVPPVIAREAALEAVSSLARSMISRLTSGKRRIVSSELVYLPFWRHDFVIAAKGREPVIGRIAIETRSRTPALLPPELETRPLPQAARRLPAGGPADPEAAKKAVWFEALTIERRKRDFVVEIGEGALLYLPYWIVYTNGKALDLAAVDATTGKVDLPMRAPLLTALLEVQTGAAQTAS